MDLSVAGPLSKALNASCRDGLRGLSVKKDYKEGLDIHNISTKGKQSGEVLQLFTN